MSKSKISNANTDGTADAYANAKVGDNPKPATAKLIIQTPKDKPVPPSPIVREQPAKNSWAALLGEFRTMSTSGHLQPPYSRDPNGRAIILTLMVLSAVDKDPPTNPRSAVHRLLGLVPHDSFARKMVLNVLGRHVER